jgi:dienelactone hydrolase
MKKHLQSIRRLAAVFLAVTALVATTFAGETLIYFSSLDRSNPLKVSGTLYLPDTPRGPCPAVVMVHGTSGINSVGAFYRDSIRRAGIAVFEVNFKTGIYTGPKDRPAAATLVALGFAALKELRKLPNIDPDRVGIMGFSMGGHLAVNAAFEKNRKLWMGAEKGFATHVAFYPVCKSFLSQGDCQPTGAPMIIFYGTKDAYGEGENVPLFKRLLSNKYHFEVTAIEYAGACHDFNRNEPPLSYYDPAAIGGKGYMEWNADAANDSLPRVVAFLRQSLAAK